MATGPSALTWTAVALGVVLAGGIGFVTGRTLAVTEPQPPVQLPPPAQPQAAPVPAAPTTTTETLGSWALVCDIQTPTNCLATQSVKTEADDLILIVVAGYNSNGQKTLEARAPLGVRLGDGLEFKVGEQKAENFIFSVCTPESCNAPLSFDEANFEKVLKRGSFQLTYVTADGTKVESKIVLDGLADAYKRIPAPTAETPAPAPETPKPAEAPKTP